MVTDADATAGAADAGADADIGETNAFVDDANVAVSLDGEGIFDGDIPVVIFLDGLTYDLPARLAMMVRLGIKGVCRGRRGGDKEVPASC
jgi:hypothetical protein